MAKVVYLKSDGTLSIIHPVDGEIETAKKSLPSGVNFEVIEDSKIPTDRTFRNAWTIEGTSIKEDLTKSKTIAHLIRREKRATEFKPYDEIVSLSIPGQDSTAAESERVKIRAKYETMQTNINNATNTSAIKTALGA